MFKNYIIKNFKKLEFQVIIALFLALCIWNYFPQIIPYFGWMWEIFMKLLKVFLWPLLFLSILVAILWVWDFKKLWNIWTKTFAYYMLTTTLAIWCSLILMNICKPWVWANFWFEKWFNSTQVESLTFISFLKWLIPNNIFVSFVEFNAMQIVIMWIILWISILVATQKESIKKINEIFEILLNWILKFIEFVIKLTPFWVFAIVAKVVAENWISSMEKLLPFSFVILLALFIHSVIILPFLWFFVWNFNPYIYFLKVKEAILVWFSTASSSATMWLSMGVAEKKANLSKEVVNFTFPIWTTINMDWTALYQAWVAIFVSQILWIDLSIISQLTIVLIVILASIWAAWIPWAWIIILTTVFLSIWLPVEAIWIILAVDRILDMFRTWVNIWWDLLTAKVVDTFYRKEISKKAVKRAWKLQEIIEERAENVVIT